MVVKKEVKGIDAGVYIRFDNLFVCSCGRNEVGAFRKPTVCPDCGTTRISEVERLNKKGRVRVDSILDLKEKDDRSFHIIKKELAVYIDEETKEGTLKVASTFELIYSLKDKSLKVLRNGKESEDVDRFFRNITDTEVLAVASTPNNRELFKVASNKLGKMGDERSSKLSRGLERLWEYPNLELFNFSGFSHVLDDIFNSYSWKKTPGITKPNEILGVPKYLMKYIKKLPRLDSWDLRYWTKLDSKLGGNNFKTILEIIEDESEVTQVQRLADNYIELVENYGYKNHKHLMTYLARDIKLQQGITSPSEGAMLLRDYNRMCKAMDINPEKYPKSLKKDHDIASMNYSVLQDMTRKENFAKVMEGEEWSNILYTGKELTVIKPTEPADLVKEGDSLGHCVKSYVDDVIKEKCKILFIRPKGLEDESLLTVEVRGNKDDGLRIVQVRGRSNRLPVAKEKEFITEWAKKKELREAY